MMTWYNLANVALVGGSLVDIGGHNPVEPASVATPVIMGRYTQSCQSVIDKLAKVGALYQPNNAFYRPVKIDGSTASAKSTADQQHGTDSADDNADDNALIYEQLEAWLSDLPLATQAGQAGETMTMQQQAVLTRQFTMIEDVIEQYSPQNLGQKRP